MDLSIFDETPAVVPRTEGELGKLEARRAYDRKRQRKCRALKKWRARTANMPQFKEQPFPPEAEIAILGAVFCGRKFAERCFRLVETKDITDDALRLIFDTAGTVFEKGKDVSRETVLAQLKSEGVIFIDAGGLIDTVIELSPRRFQEGDVDDWSAQLAVA